MQRPLLERASWIAGILSAFVAIYVWLAPPKSTSEQAIAAQQPKPVSSQAATPVALPVVASNAPAVTHVSTTQTNSQCPTKIAIETAVSKASEFSTYDNRDTAYTTLTKDAICIKDLNLAKSIAAKISTYNGRDNMYQAIVVAALETEDFDLAEKVASSISTYNGRDSAKKKIFDAVRKRG